MRLKICVMLFISLIFISSVSAFSVSNTKIPADVFDFYGDFVAYGYGEDIFFYDLRSKESTFISKGSNPSVYGFIIAFDAKESDLEKDVNFDDDFDDSVICYYDIKNKKLIISDFIGVDPSVYGNFISFSVDEKEVNMDLNNDGDSDDLVINVYDYRLDSIRNSAQVGEQVSSGLGVIAFLTDEESHGFDLDGDSSLSDKVVRVMFLDDLSVVNSGFVGEDIKLFKDKFLVFSSREDLSRLDINDDDDFDDFFPVVLSLPDLDRVVLNRTGKSPGVFGDVLVFSDENKFSAVELSSGMFFSDDVYCSSPVIFEDMAVFLTHEKLAGDLDGDGKEKDSVIRVFYFDDSDNDDFFDVLDNCPEISNDQSDWDMDFQGDACDPDKPLLNSSNITSTKNVSDSFVSDDLIDEDVDVEGSLEGIVETVKSEKDDLEEEGSSFWDVFFIILLIILILFFFARFLPPYLRKRRKSFGF